MISVNKHKLCVAPMMERTDRHCRFLFRLLSPNSFLYTEMITPLAIIKGRKNLIKYDEIEHPIAIQLGGSNPNDLSNASIIAEDYGYDEINLNIGCPSNRVKSGNFGACLMNSAHLVAESIDKIKNKVDIPVTVKTRVGIDNYDSYDFLYNFINAITSSGCKTVLIHARKAILSGFSPKQNRNIPKLEYNKVYRIKKDFPEIEIVINGGIVNKSSALDHLQYVDGVMIGRAAYKNPFFLKELEKVFFNSEGCIISRKKLGFKYLDYMREEIRSGTPITLMTRHLIGLYFGLPGSRHWKESLSKKIENIDSLEKIFNQSERLVEK